MKLADKPVYPHEDNRQNQYIHEGLTYKQWLVGMLASNPSMTYWFDGNDGYKYGDPIKTAIAIINQANAIISELEKENE